MIQLTSVSDLEKALAERRRPVVLFKHSTQCPISAEADGEYHAFVAGHPTAAVFTHLDLLAHRDVSNAIADRLGVRHESPQAIVVRGGRVSAVLNHDAITSQALTSLLAP
jgi:bacillithiol system protein YtxJ